MPGKKKFVCQRRFTMCKSNIPNYLVTPKKIFFHLHFKNLIITLKVIRKKQQRIIYLRGQLRRASQLDYKNMELLNA
jgi:hypothetical protein